MHNKLAPVDMDQNDHTISKTQAKEAMLALQSLGEQLILLKKSELDNLS